jgi:hypothetical protein
MYWIAKLYLIGLLLVTGLLIIPRPKCTYLAGTGKDAITKISFQEELCR